MLDQSDRDEIRAIVREELARAKRRPEERAARGADPFVAQLRAALATRPPFGRVPRGEAWAERGGATTADVLDALGVPEGERTRAMTMRAAYALRACGWELAARNGGGNRSRIYRRTVDLGR